MGRSVSVGLAIILLLLTTGLAGCGGGATKAAQFPVPARITLSPATDASLDVGLIQSFTAAAQNNKQQNLTEPISFHSSNTAVLTVASNGLACAGSWDSLSNPQICTPGPVGVAQVTASARGVSSPPTTVYVHQHIQNIQVSPVTPPTTPCFSKDQTFNYAARAYSLGENNSLVDITSTVGTFAWQAVNPNVVILSTTASGLLPGQAQAVAHFPGVTAIFASVSGVNSLPISFATCSVKSITLEVSGSSDNSFSVTVGGSKSITATVVDTLDNTITQVPLTWSSSETGVVTVSSSGLASGVRPGTSTIIASCTPPTCNIGLLPTVPIYPAGVVNATVTGTTSTTTVFVATTGCTQNGQPIDGCTSTIVPVNGTTVGTGITLPATPNSMVFSRDGTRAYLGTELGLLGSKGLMVLDPATPALSEHTSVTGKVLTVSPDGKKVIISHTNPNEPPNQAFVFDTTNNSTVALPIAGVTAADFSPDSLKAYILARNTPCSSGLGIACLYVYSTVDALRAIPLLAPVNDVSFLSEGAFAYLAGGDPAGVVVYRTCDNTIATDATEPGPIPQILTTPAVPSFIKTLGSASKVLDVDSPGIDLITVNNLNADDCLPEAPPLPPTPNVSNSVSSFNFGQGNFVPTQLIVSPDSSRAYVFTTNLGSVLVFNIGSQTSSAIALTGNAIPIQASLTPDGTLLYVAASDGTVHVLDTVAGSDTHQISFPQNFCNIDTITCNPDLIVVQP
jgi:hypothetical protein